VFLFCLFCVFDFWVLVLVLVLGLVLREGANDDFDDDFDFEESKGKGESEFKCIIVFMGDSRADDTDSEGGGRGGEATSTTGLGGSCGLHCFRMHRVLLGHRIPFPHGKRTFVCVLFCVCDRRGGSFICGGSFIDSGSSGGSSFSPLLPRTETHVGTRFTIFLWYPLGHRFLSPSGNCSGRTSIIVLFYI
jgi:hypothetical protein